MRDYSRYRPIAALSRERRDEAIIAYSGIVHAIECILAERRCHMQLGHSTGIVEQGIARRLAGNARQLIAACGTRVDARTIAALRAR